MPDEPVVICRLCGLGIRELDAAAKVADAFLHASCAEAAYSDRPEWTHTAIGTLNQLSRGAVSGGGTL